MRSRCLALSIQDQKKLRLFRTSRRTAAQRRVEASASARHSSLLFPNADDALHTCLQKIIVADENLKYDVVGIEKSTMAGQVNSLALSTRKKRMGLPINVMYS